MSWNPIDEKTPGKTYYPKRAFHRKPTQEQEWIPEGYEQKVWREFDQQQQEVGIILTNLSGYAMGCAVEEAGMNIQKVSVKTTIQNIEVKDNIGRIVGTAAHSLKQEYAIDGFIAGNTGVMAADVGGLITIANVVSLGGVTTGACVLEDLTADYETGALNKVSLKVTRYPDIPANAGQTII